MNTGQVLLSIIAFAFLGTVLVNFNHLVLASNEDMSNSHDVILGTTIAATYLDEAQSLAFDQVAINTPIYDPNSCTPPENLGPDSGEAAPPEFDDFDDYNGYVAIDTAQGNNGVFESDFTVSYVDPENINFRSMPTFMKRLDIKTWRIDIPFTVDTVNMFTTMAYFRWN